MNRVPCCRSWTLCVYEGHFSPTWYKVKAWNRLVGRKMPSSVYSKAVLCLLFDMDLVSIKKKKPLIEWSEGACVETLGIITKKTIVVGREIILIGSGIPVRRLCAQFFFCSSKHSLTGKTVSTVRLKTAILIFQDYKRKCLAYNLSIHYVTGKKNKNINGHCPHLTHYLIL